MTGMSTADGDHATGSQSPRTADTDPGARGQDSSAFARGVSRSIWILEHAQDVVTVAVGIVLIALAVVLLVSGVADSLAASRNVLAAALVLVDRILLVLILVEIVHTVVLSLRAHQLAAKPFIIVGMVAVIRRILFVLSPGNQATVTTSELALLIAMVAVFVAGLIAVSHFEKQDE